VTASSCVDHLVEALKAIGGRRQIGRLPFASIGPVTTASVRRCGGRVIVEARRSTIEGLAEAIVRRAGRRRRA